MEEVEANMARMAGLGLDIHITEMDVQIQKGTGAADYDRESQAQIYQYMATACLRISACKMLVVWGVTDLHSWIRPDKPLLFDEAYAPKPAFFGIRRALEME
jgi:endo-1,4-beta-xylanase